MNVKKLLADACPVCGKYVDQKKSTVYYKPMQLVFHPSCWYHYRQTHNLRMQEVDEFVHPESSENRSGGSPYMANQQRLSSDRMRQARYHANNP